LTETLRTFRNRLMELPPWKRALFLPLLVSLFAYLFWQGAIGIFNHFFILVHTRTNSDYFTSFVCTRRTYSVSELNVGDYVYFPYRGERQYPQYGVANGELLVKMVAALPGMKVKVDDHYVYINGQITGAVLHTDRTGNLVDYFHYDGPVPSGKVFVMAPHPRSFDSRYWGFVDESWGLHKCWPLPLSDR